MVLSKPVAGWLRTCFAITAMSAVVLFAGIAWSEISGARPVQTALNMATARWVDGRTPGQLIRYALVRLDGHPKLTGIANPLLLWLQSQFERNPPEQTLTTLGKGQQPKSLQPIAGQGNGSTFVVGSSADIVRAVSIVQAGQTVLISPGTYRIVDNLKPAFAGSANQPITFRAAEPGQVVLEFDMLEGVVLAQPYWIFENLHIRGVCQQHTQCEHAFHVFGKAHHTVIRNNYIADFNAHIKVNGSGGDWPDDGLLAFNTLTNTSRRETHLPVTPVDMVGADRWSLVDNFVSNFVKADGDKISYGMFMKGGGRGGRIERNLIVCTPDGISQPGARVGISLGGGGTGKAYCRDVLCDSEYTNGLVANNIVAHCNDSGLDVNRSSNNLLAFNTLLNTAGIDVRNSVASAQVYGNLLEGRIHARGGGQIKESMNELKAMNSVYVEADALKFECANALEKIPSHPVVPTDFNGASRKDGTLPGAFANACE